jgi:hypothetical protein
MLLVAFVKMRKATVSFFVFVRPSAWNNSAPTAQISTKLDGSEFLETLSNKLKLPWFGLQLDALNSRLFTYNTFIKLLYMFRALTLLIIRRSTS